MGGCAINRKLFCLLALLSAQVGYGASASPNLEAKLKTQWKRYEFATSSLIERLRSDLPLDQKKISREEWESWLAVPPLLQLSPADFEQLEKKQTYKINQVRERNEKSSKINLQALRDLPPEQSRAKIYEFCSKFPKGGMLHIHPGGTLQRDAALEILNFFNPKLPLSSILRAIKDPALTATLTPEEIVRLEAMGPDQNYLSLSFENQQNYLDLMFLPRGKQPFERFDGVFLFVRPVLHDWSATEAAYLQFAKLAALEKVSYVEFSTGVAESYLKILTDILDHIQTQTGVVIRLNSAFHRSLSDSELENGLDDLHRIQNDPHIVGINLVGNETRRSAFEAGQFLYGSLLAENRLGKSCLRRTMHTGELGDAHNPRDAILLGAERLGHGVRLNEDPVALEYASRHHIPIEVNLTSNLRLGAVDELGRHPFLKQLRLGLPISLSTDDEGIFEIDINHECEVAIAGTDVNYSEMKQMSFNSIETSFASKRDKKRMLEGLKEQFSVFEAESISEICKSNILGCVNE